VLLRPWSENSKRLKKPERSSVKIHVNKTSQQFYISSGVFGLVLSGIWSDSEGFFFECQVFVLSYSENHRLI
jgi:hypothetical protein